MIWPHCTCLTLFPPFPFSYSSFQQNYSLCPWTSGISIVPLLIFLLVLFSLVRFMLSNFYVSLKIHPKMQFLPRSLLWAPQLSGSYKFIFTLKPSGHSFFHSKKYCIQQFLHGSYRCWLYSGAKKQQQQKTILSYSRYLRTYLSFSIKLIDPGGQRHYLILLSISATPSTEPAPI